ncbi:MAG: class I SAM-dependent methyltransferase [bacterium]
MFRRYGKLGTPASLYVRARYFLGQYTLLEGYVPKEGAVLDFGCGMGQLAVFLKIAGEGREVYGCDTSPRRIEIARKASEGLTGIHFTSAAEPPPGGWNAVIFFDSLHYLPEREQDGLVLEQCERILPGGVLLIRDVHVKAFMKFSIAFLHENVMVRSGFTPTPSKRLYFRNMDDFKKLLSGRGFTVDMAPPPLLHPYADYLIVAAKPVS